MDSCIATPIGIATSNGVVFDRTFMIVNKTTGKFLSQRTCPRMALIDIDFEPRESILTDPSFELKPEHPCYLVLSAPGMDADLKIPLHTLRGADWKDHILRVNVWEWYGAAFSVGKEAEEWVSRYLQLPASLVRYVGDHASLSSIEVATTSRMEQPSDISPLYRGERSRGVPADVQEKTMSMCCRRHVDSDWADPMHEVAFSDGFPYLLASQASLADINAMLEVEGLPPVSMVRFRPNIVVDGVDMKPWEEDGWDTISICSKLTGHCSLQFDLVKPCSRCKIPSINPETAEEEVEPNATLHRIRSGFELGWMHPASFKRSIFFGVNMCVRLDPLENIERESLWCGHVVQRGDAVCVVARRSTAEYTMRE